MNCQLIDLTATDIVANAILILNKKNGRRSITVHEYNAFLRQLKDLAVDQDIFISINYRTDDKFDLYFDKIMIDDTTQVYRLKPEYTVSMLRNEFISLLPVKLLVLFNHPALLDTFTDFTLKEEQENPKIQQLDEAHQLKCIYEILELEKQQRELELKLGVMQNNTQNPIRMESISSPLKLNPGSFKDFNREYHQSR